MDDPTLIYETVHGSQAYGLAREGSDLDVRGAIVGPRAWYFGFRGAPEQVAASDDHVHYEIRKLLRLAVENNPSVLEVLFTSPEDHRVVTPAGERLLALGPRLLSKRVAETFAGYARGQLKRIRTHRRWLLSPPAGAPTRAAFGLPERTVIPKDQLGAAEALIESGRLDEAELDAPFLEVLRREKQYRAAQREWAQYESWRGARNPKRAELEARFGYDTKHAMHLVRLMRMAEEILRDGRVLVRRPDRDELLAVRDGAWAYARLEEEADQLAERVREAAAESALPDAPDEAFVEREGIAIVEEVLAC
jgi:predicted nucleotidyltransferase